MKRQVVMYLAGPEASQEEAKQIAAKRQCDSLFYIERRGIALGWIGSKSTATVEPRIDPAKEWRHGAATVIRQPLLPQLTQFESQMERSYALIEGLLDGESLVHLMQDEGYFDRISQSYQFIGAYSDESDRQGIEALEFEVREGEKLVADNVWMKASWLSFTDDDASLRFRFSYGREGLEDVASNFALEQHTAALAEEIFPESKMITANESLCQSISQIGNIAKPAFVERIYYFNAPNGGAQFHHDVERGHDGVVYAQLFGSTAWLAIPKPVLLDEILQFLSRSDVEEILSALMTEQNVTHVLNNRTDRSFWSDKLDDRESEIAEQLLNHIPAFFAQLVDGGYAHVINAGDIILLPQASLQECCWHSVFCLDDFPGEALSFAIRESIS